MRRWTVLALASLASGRSPGATGSASASGDVSQSTGRASGTRERWNICKNAALGLALLASASGCSLVPRTQLDDCARRCRALQTETAQLKDEALSLRSQNRDLAQRAVDDHQRLQLVEEANRRLEQSVTAYQKERDDFAVAFDRFKGQVQAAADAPTATASRAGP